MATKSTIGIFVPEYFVAKMDPNVKCTILSQGFFPESKPNHIYMEHVFWMIQRYINKRCPHGTHY